MVKMMNTQVAGVGPWSPTPKRKISKLHSQHAAECARENIFVTHLVNTAYI